MQHGMRRRRGDARRGGIGMPAPTLEPVTIFAQGSARQLVTVGWDAPTAVKLERGRKMRSCTLAGKQLPRRRRCAGGRRRQAVLGRHTRRRSLASHHALMMGDSRGRTATPQPVVQCRGGMRGTLPRGVGQTATRKRHYAGSREVADPRGQLAEQARTADSSA